MKIKLIFATCVFSTSVAAQDTQQSDVDPFAFYVEQDNRPFSTIRQLNYSGELQFGIGYIPDDNFTYGRYNGLNDKGAYLDLSGRYRSWQIDNDWADYFILKAKDLGLDTRSGSASIGRLQEYRVGFEFDQQKQVKNLSGYTPFTRESGQMYRLPTNWVTGNNTSDMTAFDDVSRRFNQELERKGYTISYEQMFGPEWSFTSEFRSQDKKGNQATGAAIFANASNGHAAILPKYVDQTTYKLDLGIGYSRDFFNLTASYLYSKYDNNNQSYTWQNPYGANLGLGTAYPDGMGRIAAEPDNDMHQIRLIGNYVFSADLRVSGDVSYSKASQDQQFIPYTVNPSLPVIGLPRGNLDGEMQTTTAKANLYYRLFRKLSFQFNAKYEDRDNKSPRDGYLGVTGDAFAPIDPKFHVYNSPHSRNLTRFDGEATYQLPWSTRISALYGYEEIKRYNTSVNKTEEDIWQLTVRSRPMQGLNLRLEAEYKDRGASEYQWDQSYFALYDVEMINQTPDNQRYTNHPLMSQYYIANREQTRAKLNLGYHLSSQWQLNLNGMYLKNDYDQTELGLQQSKTYHGTLSASWIPSTKVSGSLYYSYDQTENDQAGRAFSGGIDKSAFEIYPPLPQASDPSRNWYISPKDETNTIGANARWQAIRNKLDFSWDYRYTDSSNSLSGIRSGGALALTNLGFPDTENKEHHFDFNTVYELREDLSLSFNYQYYRYKGRNWAIDGVNPNTIDKFLASGEQSANDQMHIFGVSVAYYIK